MNDGPANPPWRKLPRVAIKDEPEVNAHSRRNLHSSVTEPSLSPTCRDNSLVLCCTTIYMYIF